ncbi:uncharacterized protein LOC144869160 [Branchiostoma floridae x Branchiostoma japonicum]
MYKFVTVAVVLLVGIVVTGADDPPPEIVEEMPPLPSVEDVPPMTAEQWLDLRGNTQSGRVKRQAGHCRNLYGDCGCFYFKYQGHCDSDTAAWRNWMNHYCKAACEICEPEPGESQCANKYEDGVCASLLNYLPNPRYQRFVTCGCPKACGLCTETQDQETIVEAMANTDQDFREDCLKYHNLYRADHNADDLTWDERCAEEAQKAAERLRDRGDGQMEHTSRAGRFWGGKAHGENLAYITDATPETVTEYWYEERNDYNPANPVRSFRNDNVGHFTQMVWKATKKVGCGQAGNFFACMYEPTGNHLSTAAFRRNVDP